MSSWLRPCSRGGGRPPRSRRSRWRSRSRHVGMVTSMGADDRARGEPDRGEELDDAARRAVRCPRWRLTRRCGPRTGGALGQGRPGTSTCTGTRRGAADLGGQLAEAAGGARSMTAGSHPARSGPRPRSASPSRRRPRLMVAGSNQAISSSDVGGASRRSRSGAAHHRRRCRPARSSPSQMSRSSAVRVRSTSSRVVSVSPSRARRTRRGHRRRAARS